MHEEKKDGETRGEVPCCCTTRAKLFAAKVIARAFSDTLRGSGSACLTVFWLSLLVIHFYFFSPSSLFFVNTHARVYAKTVSWRGENDEKLFFCVIQWPQFHREEQKKAKKERVYTFIIFLRGNGKKSGDEKFFKPSNFGSFFYVSSSLFYARILNSFPTFFRFFFLFI